MSQCSWIQAAMQSRVARLAAQHDLEVVRLHPENVRLRQPDGKLLCFRSLGHAATFLDTVTKEQNPT